MSEKLTYLFQGGLHVLYEGDDKVWESRDHCWLVSPLRALGFEVETLEVDSTDDLPRKGNYLAIPESLEALQAHLIAVQSKRRQERIQRLLSELEGLGVPMGGQASEEFLRSMLRFACKEIQQHNRDAKHRTDAVLLADMEKVASEPPETEKGCPPY